MIELYGILVIVIVVFIYNDYLKLPSTKGKLLEGKIDKILKKANSNQGVKNG